MIDIISVLEGVNTYLDLVPPVLPGTLGNKLSPLLSIICSCIHIFPLDVDKVQVFLECSASCIYELSNSLHNCGNAPHWYKVRTFHVPIPVVDFCTQNFGMHRMLNFLSAFIQHRHKITIIFVPELLISLDIAYCFCSDKGFLQGMGC